MEYTVDEAKGFSERLVRGFKHWQFGNKAQLAFLEDLYTLIADGIPANRAIDMMSQVTQGLPREVALSISQKIAEGQPLADGMRDWFSINVVEIIRVGETGGALAQTMKSAINMLSQQGMAFGAFIGAIAYPLFVFVVACIVIVFLRHKVFTQFELIKPMDQWPPEGKRLVYIAEIIQHGWWILIIAILAIIAFFKYMLKNYIGEYRSTLDRFPPFSFYKRLTAARILETLGLLVANGVVFKSAIKVMQYRADPYTLNHLERMESLLSMGKTNIADVLDTGLIETSDLQRLRVMAEVKGFEHGLVRMGVRGAEGTTATLKFISKVVGGVILIIGFLLILSIISGIYMTGMSMGQQ